MKAQVNSVLVNSNQAARILGISYEQLRRIIHKKTAPISVHRFGASMLFNTSELQESKPIVTQVIEAEIAKKTAKKAEKKPHEKKVQFNCSMTLNRREAVRKVALERNISIGEVLAEIIDKHLSA